MTPFPGADSSATGLWVRSDTLPTGGYGVAIAAADLDAALARCLVSTVGVDQPRAAAMVAALADHWPATDAPRREKGSPS